MSLRRLIEMLRKTADAVGYAHSQRVIHCDLKPANIMIGEHGSVWVLDWGLARELDAIDQESSHSAVVGTPTYMSPEQARGDVCDLGPQADVYALGAILYHILSGQPPFQGKKSADVITKVIHSSPIPLSNLIEQQSELEEPIAICEKTMNRDPSKSILMRMHL